MPSVLHAAHALHAQLCRPGLRITDVCVNVWCGCVYVYGVDVYGVDVWMCVYVYGADVCMCMVWMCECVCMCMKGKCVAGTIHKF